MDKSRGGFCRPFSASPRGDTSSFFSPNVPFRWLNGGTVLLSCPVAVLLSWVRNEIKKKEKEREKEMKKNKRDIVVGERGSYIRRRVTYLTSRC